MEIKCESWRSKWQINRISDNPHYLARHDIAKVRPSRDEKLTWGQLENNVFIRAEKDGVLMETGVEGLNISGCHLVTIRLTKAEIINLVKIAWEGNDFIKALSRS